MGMSLKPHQYSDHFCNQTIGIIGPYPPRIGGISIHIKRVVYKLKQQNNQISIIDVATIPTRLGRWWALIKFLHQNRTDTIFYHTLYNSSIEWLITVLGRYLYRYQLILVEHSPRYLYARRTIDKWLFRLTMRAARQQIFIGTTTHQSYIDNKIPLTAHISIESAYLPPDPSEEPVILATYPPALWQFLQTHSPLIAINASRMTLWHGKDLYGIDVTLALLHQLKEKFPQIGLICALAERDNPAYFAKLEQYIRDNQLADSVFFLEDRKEFWPLLKQVDLFLRPTLSDSEGISILEALWCNTPVVASDACDRAAGTVLYKTGDQEDLYEKVMRTLLINQTQGHNKTI
jgi:glycosyltransferase involved in cell wall biosynthesis